MEEQRPARVASPALQWSTGRTLGQWDPATTTCPVRAGSFRGFYLMLSFLYSSTKVGHLFYNQEKTLKQNFTLEKISKLRLEGGLPSCGFLC